MKTTTRTQFEEELYYWIQQQMNAAGTELLDEPMPRYQARQRVIDYYRKFLNPEQSFSYNEQEVSGWDGDTEPCHPCHEHLMIEGVALNAGSTFPTPEELVALWGTFEDMRDAVSDHPKRCKLLALLVRTADVDLLLKSEHLEWIRAQCGDVYPSSQLEIAEALGYKTRSKGRVASSYEKFRQRFVQALLDAGINPSELLS